jgi:hypothetical protein
MAVTDEANTQRHYYEVRADLKTGDLVFFSGKSAFSRAVQLFSASPWSHVGMVMNLPQYDFVCLYEATALYDLRDLDTGVFRDGVQLVPLSQRLEQYQGAVAYRKLNGFDLAEDHHKSLLNLRTELKGRRWEQSKLELVKAMYDGPLGRNTEDFSSLFCAELVARCYQVLGLVPSGDGAKRCNEYVPADFAADRCSQLMANASLGPEVMLKLS